MQNLISPELQCIFLPLEVMAQIGMDICNLPEINGYKQLVVCVDFFPKWSETKPLKDKLAESVSFFLCEIICRHGFMVIQKNDQGRSFVNDVIAELHEMTSPRHFMTSPSPSHNPGRSASYLRLLPASKWSL